MGTARKTPEAVVFDMDGVLVDSARLHARAWKETFDEFLAQQGDPKPFALPDDYRRYVDGRPRYEGVVSFLRSRGLTMPMGDPSDSPGMTTMTALGNLKNQAFHRLLETESVEPLAGVEDMLDRLLDARTPMAVVSSSRNIDLILPASIAVKVDLVLGGNDLDEMEIPGKPAPDMFTRAAADIGVTPRECAVVEDSPAGVRAGRRGGFSLVVGIDDGHGSSAMADLSDVVVKSVAELPAHVASWSDLLEPPPSALENIDTIRRLLGGRPEVGSSALYVGDDEDELLAVRQLDGVGVLVDSAPPAMTWADFSVPDQENGDELRARLADSDPQSAE
ncbi:MAG TPA: HAD-IA family hydrolase [Acidimicrobiia bacterium]